MSSRPRDSREQPPAAHFPEAVAQWRLAMRTEVKRTSSLPSSMFDACDPMLEMRLAESTEAMLACLHEPSVPALKELDGASEQRVEKVTADELRVLPQRLRGGEQLAVDVDDGLAGEALAVLADACCSGHEPAAAGAARILQAQFDVAPAAAPELAAAALLPLLEQTVTGAPASAGHLGGICRRIAELMQQHTVVRDDGALP
jgi:hypothetical protein